MCLASLGVVAAARLIPELRRDTSPAKRRRTILAAVLLATAAAVGLAAFARLVGLAVPYSDLLPALGPFRPTELSVFLINEFVCAAGWVVTTARRYQRTRTGRPFQMWRERRRARQEDRTQRWLEGCWAD